METLTILISIIGVLGTLSTIYFAYAAHKKSNIQEQTKHAKDEGTIVADIGYIKSCVDHVDKSLAKLDERYQDIVERLAKTEVTLCNVIKRVDEIYKIEGG